MTFKMNTAACLLLLLHAAILCRSQADLEGDSCNTPDGNAGACTNIRRCEPLLQILRSQGQQPGAADFLRRSVCGYADRDPVVCCPGVNPRSPMEVPPVPQTQDGLPVPDECGFSNISHTRVVGGVPAPKGAWPWMVALGYRQTPSQKPRFLCGASLITTRHVLTAAHCVFNRRDLYLARLGEHDLESNNDGASPIDVLIQGKKIHEGYTSSSFVNDIAILTLQKSITPTPQIRPICLPSSAEQKEKNYVGTRPFIAGWGAKHFSGPSNAELHELQVPVVTQEKCQKAFARFKSAVIDDRVLCAGYDAGGKDACQGDSGGPLMAPNKVIYYQIGVVSFGYRCAEPGVPGVYTKVTSFIDWIIKNVQ